MRHAQHDLALVHIGGQAVKRLVVQSQHLAGIAQKLLSFGREPHFAGGAVKDVTA